MWLKSQKHCRVEYVISNFNVEEVVGTFYKRELQETNQKEFRVEKVVKKKGDKLYVKWKGYNNSLNCWIDKKDIVHSTNEWIVSKTKIFWSKCKSWIIFV